MSLSPTVRAATAALSMSALAIGRANTPTRESTGANLDDSTITTKVKPALVGDPQTKARDISVRTYRGEVQLSGFITFDEEPHEAVRDARNVEGVRSVEDEMRVGSHSTSVGTAINDTDLTARVKAALIGDPQTKARQIDATTENAIVQLSGFVDSNDERDEAATVAESVQGVKAVDNGLPLKPLPQ